MHYTTYKNTYSTNQTQILTNISILYGEKRYNTVAMWDTGASNTHISESILDLLGVEPYGETSTISHRGSETVKKYKVSLFLPTNYFVDNITVLSGNYFKINGIDIGALIGMDIIQCGDFHIDFTGERAIFTFCHPSDADEDVLIETELF